ncbi:MAG TPA: homocysteine S-methyltransferase family protein [Pseudomonadota bacterium]|nr:homocysteine S-methyltransferase family protein [Pseudomonadota bacterium]
MNPERSSLLRRLARKDLARVLWDGGMGTALVARGLDLCREPPEAWLWSHLGDVIAVHEGFVSAGVDVLQTNSFGLLRLAVSGQLPTDPRTGRVPTLFEQVKQSVDLARQAQAQTHVEGQADAFVVGSIGPTGLRGLDPVVLQNTAEELARAFAACGVSGIMLETCLCPHELAIVQTACRAGAMEVPLFVSVAVVAGPFGLCTPTGTALDKMLEVLRQDPPDLIGANCALCAEDLVPVIGALAAFAKERGGSVPVLARPQLHRDAPAGRWAKDVSPARFASGLGMLVGAGATAVGGCCGVTSAHLLAVRHALEGFLWPPSTL